MIFFLKVSYIHKTLGGVSDKVLSLSKTNLSDTLHRYIWRSKETQKNKPKKKKKSECN